MNRDLRDKAGEPGRPSVGDNLAITGRTQPRVAASGSLSYTNSRGTYGGATPHDVLEALYEEGKGDWTGTDPYMSYPEWKKWNQEVWKAKYDLDLPLEDTREAEFLQGLVTAGVLKSTD